jgi:hypothetical protein
MYQNKTTKQGMVRARFDKNNTVGSRMSQQGRIRTRNIKVIQRTRSFDTLDLFVVHRTSPRMTIRYQVLKILSYSWEGQTLLHQRK